MATSKKKTQSKKSPKKTGVAKNHERTFMLFVLWLNMPKFMKGISEKEIQKLGIENEDMLEVIPFRTQKAFAQHYEVDESTLWEWKKRPECIISMDEIRKWAQNYAPDVIGSIIAHTTKTKGSPVPAMYDKFFHLVMNKSADPNQHLAEQQAIILEKLNGLFPD